MTDPKTIAHVALGSNLGDRDSQLAGALDALSKTHGISVEAVSSVYETDPVGPPPQEPYLNAVARIEVEISPRALLERLFAIEQEAGRERGDERWLARTLDLDLLLFGDQQIDEPGLTVPHPRLHERAFVLTPLAELDPDTLHPVLGESLAVLAKRRHDPVAVRARGESQILKTRR